MYSITSMSIDVGAKQATIINIPVIHLKSLRCYRKVTKGQIRRVEISGSDGVGKRETLSATRYSVKN